MASNRRILSECYSTAYTNIAKFLCIFVISCAGCQRPTPTGSLGTNPKAPITVNVVKATKTNQSQKTVSYFGKLVASRRQTLGFAVGGTATLIPKSRQRFESGSVLAELERSELIQRRDEIEAELRQVPDELTNSTRRQQLQLQSAQLKQQIDQRAIVAPFDCVVERVFVSSNSLVRANVPVISVVDAGKPRIQISLPRRIANLYDDSREYIFLLDGKTVFAVLADRSITEVQPGSIELSFDIQSELQPDDFALGQIIEAQIDFSTQESGYWLPLTALRKSSSGLWSVYVVEDDDAESRLRQRLVEVKQVQDTTALVTGDLEGVAIVVNGLHRVVPGQRVEINLEATASDVAVPDGEP